MPQGGGGGEGRNVSETNLSILDLFTVEGFCLQCQYVYCMFFDVFFSYTLIYFIGFSELYVVKHTEYAA